MSRVFCYYMCFFISNIVSNIDQKELKSMYLNDVLYTTFK